MPATYAFLFKNATVGYSPAPSWDSTSVLSYVNFWIGLLSFQCCFCFRHFMISQNTHRFRTEGSPPSMQFQCFLGENKFVLSSSANVNASKQIYAENYLLLGIFFIFFIYTLLFFSMGTQNIIHPSLLYFILSLWLAQDHSARRVKIQTWLPLLLAWHSNHCRQNDQTESILFLWNKTEQWSSNPTYDRRF